MDDQISIPETPTNFILDTGGKLRLIRTTSEELYKKLRVFQFQNDLAEVKIYQIAGVPFEGIPGAITLKHVETLRCTNPVHKLVYELSAHHWIGKTEKQIDEDIAQIRLLCADRKRQLTGSKRLPPPDYDSGPIVEPENN